MKFYVCLILSLSLFFGCEKSGCTDPTSLNYDPEASKDDGSCTNHFAALGGNYAATVTRTCAVAGACDSTYQDSIKVRWEGANLRMEVATLGVDVTLVYEPSASSDSTIYYSRHGVSSNESSAGIRLKYNSQQAVADYRPGSSGLGGPSYTFNFTW